MGHKAERLKLAPTKKIDLTKENVIDFVRYQQMSVEQLQNVLKNDSLTKNEICEINALLTKKQRR